MHPLLAEALTLGPMASGRTHTDGAHMEVTSEPGLHRFELLAPGGTSPLALAWRLEAREDRPPGLPGALPFVAWISGVAVVEPTGLTVTWPDPHASPIPGLPSVPGRRAGDPGSVARSLALGGGDGAAEHLAAAFLEVVEQSKDRGWSVEDDEVLSEPVPGRVARLARDGATRTVTLSGALGVATLVLLEPAHGSTPP